jgi:hypothetical protein
MDRHTLKAQGQVVSVVVAIIIVTIILVLILVFAIIPALKGGKTLQPMSTNVTAFEIQCRNDCTFASNYTISSIAWCKDTAIINGKIWHCWDVSTNGECIYYSTNGSERIANATSCG